MFVMQDDTDKCLGELLKFDKGMFPVYQDGETYLTTEWRVIAIDENGKLAVYDINDVWLAEGESIDDE